MTSPSILIVDDEPAMREVLSLRIADWGYRVATAGDAAEAATRLADSGADLVLSDVVLPGASGLELLERLRGDDPDRPVILMTAHGTVDMAVDAMKRGAADFVTKPLDHEKLRAVLTSVLGEAAARRRARGLAESLASDRAGLGPLVGASPAMRRIFAELREVAATDAAVLLTGASGTGKELAARLIHDLSRRATKPFIALNAAAVPAELIESELFGHQRGAFTGATADRAGCFELADGGTLLLDEIAEMPVALQPKLLRVLEDGRVRRLGGSSELATDVRLVAATNAQPAAAVREGRLREDLYFRLNVFEIEMPPLGARRGDVALLAQHFIGEANARHGTAIEGVGEAALARLEEYGWPGNVRELRNVVERAVVIAKEGLVGLDHLPPHLMGDGGPGAGAKLVLPVGITSAEAEKRLILRTLEATGNNKAEAARLLGLDVKTIRNKLRSYGLS